MSQIIENKLLPFQSQLSLYLSYRDICALSETSTYAKNNFEQFQRYRSIPAERIGEISDRLNNALIIRHDPKIFHYLLNQNSLEGRQNEKILLKSIPREIDQGLLDQSIILACKNGYLNLLKKWIKEKNFSTEILNQGLIESAGSGNLEITDFLLPLTSPPFWDQAFIKASSAGHLPILNKLHEKKGIDPTLEENQSIKEAIIGGHLEVIKFLLPLVEFDLLTTLVYRNLNALQISINSGHIDLFHFLLTFDEIDLTIHDNDPLIRACQFGHTEIVRTLLSQDGINPAAQENKAFKLSAENGHLEVVKLLMECESVDITEGNHYAFRMAASNGHLEVVKLLLTRPETDPTAFYNEPIRKAVERGHLEIVELLLSINDVDPTASSNYPLIHATFVGNLEMVKLLLQRRKVRKAIPKVLKTAIEKGDNQLIDLFKSYSINQKRDSKQIDLRDSCLVM